MSSQHKIGFWSLLSLVMGSQIGSGVFMLPSTLAPFGAISLLGWVTSGIGAISLALVFARLSARLPQTGGPHVYVKESFGKIPGYFTGWTYWIISWVSSTAVIIASVGYLLPLIGDYGPVWTLALEIAILIIITGVNLRGVDAAGNAEFLLTLLKIIPLIVLPAAALCYFHQENFSMAESVQALPLSKVLAQVTLLTLWGFIGLELGTTPAGSVKNPEKNIPRAIVIGTSLAAILYLFNSIGIMGLIPGAELSKTAAPYVDLAQRLFGGHWHLAISAMACIICIGTLNAWVLSSGQIALGLAEDHLMPKAFARRNKNGAPFCGILVSSTGVIPLLILTADATIAQQIASIVDISVTAFLFVYLACAIAFIHQIWTGKIEWRITRFIYGFIGILFCLWVISETPLSVLGIAALFVFSGIPGYIFWVRPQRDSLAIQTLK